MMLVLTKGGGSMFEPSLNTPGRIAERLGIPVHRVLHVLRTRQYIRPAARAGTFRLFDEASVLAIQQEIRAIDACRTRQTGGAA